LERGHEPILESRCPQLESVLVQPPSESMKILHAHRDFPASRRSSVTIGNFDGLHLGHRQILAELVRTAAASDNASVVMTFSPHPLQILQPDKAPGLIVPSSEKFAQIESLGIEYLLLAKFDEELSRLSGQDFVRQILVDSLRAKHILVGHNFVFGHKRSGNVSLLEALGRECDYSVHVVPPVQVRGSRVSSTWIRELIRSGRVSQANRLLGRYYTLQGRTVSGQSLGKTLLFPTLNLEAQNEILPGKGVYATRALFDGKGYPGVTNVGTRPTLSGTNLSVETHLLEYAPETPPVAFQLQFLHRLRDEQQFPSIEALKQQIAKDIQRARRFFGLLERLQRK